MRLSSVILIFLSIEISYANDAMESGRIGYSVDKLSQMGWFTPRDSRGGCKWNGTAPFCNGECPDGYQQMRESNGRTSNWWMAGYNIPDDLFGHSCTTIFGGFFKKRYCCMVEQRADALNGMKRMITGSNGPLTVVTMLSAAVVLLLVVSEAYSQSCTGGIPAAEVTAILSSHNALRRSISAGTYVAKGKKMPAAVTPIPDLTWDCDIAKSAQAVSNTCVFAHSTNRVNLGENLYTMWSSNKVSFTGQGKAASDSWANEFQQYGWADVKLTAAVFNTAAHATQMAWAKSTKIGCGMTLCQNGNSVIVACQYRDQGNMLNQNVYQPKA
ncbi:hypothetical protein PRIPAC_81139 [Pristionchus pacificus]|uniref:SCP domain-containing protein n=1 Tax=Pristionchus pacificus TaxID=54126 RepID=A0A2A6CBL9_PRIPA|nr:hypothetical protein PRIPAC_81139 [Pristionchus pacificus]|eukprot:PDM75443.1 hypothetical protein PRIPAC_42620 [Pristionchus pacificus]